tara:strand:- start:5046 stop:5474 length:429 start_codon:yes stop_codon:yes gene_type:complete
MGFFDKIGQSLLNAPGNFKAGFNEYADNWQKQYQSSQKGFNEVAKSNPNLASTLGSNDWSKASPEEITNLQTQLVGQYGQGILPKHGVDGIWGSETQSALDLANTSIAKNQLLSDKKTGVVATQSYDTPVYSSPNWSFKKQF